MDPKLVTQQESRNPFNPFRSNNTGTNQAESSSAPQQPPEPPVEPSPPPALSNAFPEEEPPAYTQIPAYDEGETTLEVGPRRPFQPPPARPGSAPIAGHESSSRIQNRVVQHPTGSANSFRTLGSSSSRGGSLMRQLSNALDEVIRQLDAPQSTGRSSNTWSGNPGPRQGQSSYNWSPPTNPPPHPLRRLSTSTSHSDLRAQPTGSHQRRHSSEFAQDFYAVGTGEDAGIPTERSPSAAAPPLPPRRTMNTEAQTPIRKPTSTPVAGHPLMNDGRVLVYPQGYRCDKCQNLGYKAADPNNPCNRCWSKYAKAYTGAVAVLFENSSDVQGESGLQRPLPYQPPSQPPPPTTSRHTGPSLSFSGPGAQYREQRGPPPPRTGNSDMWNRPLTSPPARAISTFNSGAPPGAVVYASGDPRIGGNLCWRCKGKGTVSFLFERIPCDVCNGIGRVF